MLHPRAELRIGAGEVLEDRWFRTVECCASEADFDGVVIRDESEGVTVDATKKAGGCGRAALGKIRSRAVTLARHNHLPPDARRKGIGGAEGKV